MKEALLLDEGSEYIVEVLLFNRVAGTPSTMSHVGSSTFCPFKDDEDLDCESATNRIIFLV